MTVIVVAACANMGSPDGGPYDETPPVLVGTSPADRATNVTPKRIVLTFNENIKIESANEKVVISPPQKEQPEILTSGKKITINILDTLRDSTTYTIDFSDAIEDNNEGNPLGDYAFSFSTGETIDTFQISGNVLDASNLEPIKGMLVGIYSEMDDSVFKTKPFERLSRTGSRGHFVIKGINPNRKYRVYALNDQNQNYMYDQKSEMLAYTDRIISTSCSPDVRYDTIWHDSIHYDSIITVNYTHFYPDDIHLLAFQEKITDRYLLKAERPNLQIVSFYFTSPSDKLPVIKGLNFDEKNLFEIEHSAGNDTVTYWIRDSLVYNLDTLNLIASFMATDTLGQLVETSDSFEMASKITKSRLAKEYQQEYEQWVKDSEAKFKNAQKIKKRERRELEKRFKENGDQKSLDSLYSLPQDEEFVVPPMPEKFLDMKVSASSSLDPDRNIDLTPAEPIDTLHMDMVHFYLKQDTVLVPQPFILRQLPGQLRKYRFYAEWQLDTEYQLVVDTGAFVSIYGKRSAGIKKNIKVKSLDEYATLFVNLVNADTSAIVQLMDGSDRVVKTVKSKGGKADFYFITPGTYYLRLYYDRNSNGIWDTGEFDKRLQPEEVFYYPGAIKLRALWEVAQSWNPTAVPIINQKPGKITKQKPDKEKTIKSRNAERERNKKK